MERKAMKERYLQIRVEKRESGGKIAQVKTPFHLIVAALVFLAGTVRGQVMVEVAGNLGATSDASAPFTWFNTFAQQFTTGTLNPGDENQDGNVLHRFTVQLQPGYVFDPDAGDGGEYVPRETFFQWSLLSDSLGSPGGVLAGPGSFSVDSATANEFYYASLVSAGDFVLQSNTSYWLAIKYAYLGGGMSPATPVLLPLTTSDVEGGAGTLGELKESGDGWNGMLGRMVMQVDVESVPEPGSGALVVLGLGTLLMRRRRGTR